MLTLIAFCILSAGGQRAQGAETPHERLYLHLNKDLYIPGEIVWFNIYSYDLNSRTPYTGTERVANLGLYTGGGEKVLSIMLPIDRQYSSEGSIYLPGNLATGDYWLAVYPEVSSDLADSPSLFQRKIRILNPLEPSFMDILSPPAPELVLHPEGGNLIEGQRNRLAFYMKEMTIEQFPFTLFVESTDQNEIYEFTSNASGAGLFSFLPKRGENYRSYIRFKDGSYMDVDFPHAVRDKAGLRVERQGEAYRVTTFWNDPLKGDLVLKVRQYGQVIHEVPFDLSGTSDTRDISLPATTGGSCWFELWHENQRIGSRLVFHGGEEIVSLPVDLSNALDLKTREKGQFKIQTSSLGQEAMLSVSVFQRSEIPTNASKFHHLMADRWLFANQVASDGVLEEEMWYRADGNFDGLDLFVMAQKQAEPVKKSEVPPGDRFRKISFRLKNKQSGKPIASEYVFLSFPGKTERLYLSRTDSRGQADFSVDPVFGKQTAVLVSTSGLAFDFELVSDDYFSFDPHLESVNDTARRLTFAPTAWMDWMEAYNINVQAENAYFRRERADFDSTKTGYKAPFYGNADRDYKLDDYTRFVVMEEVLREYMPEVSVNRRGNNYQLRVHDKLSNLFFSGNPLVLLDGVPLSDINKVIAYDPLKIEEIAIIRSKFYYGPLEYDGVVSFKTYDGDLKDFSLENSAALFDFEGFYIHRKFFSPQHGENDDELPSSIPDLRNVLLWAGDLHTDGHGDLAIDFYTSDLKGEFVIEIEGLDKDGRVLRGRSSFQVR